MVCETGAIIKTHAKGSHLARILFITTRLNQESVLVLLTHRPLLRETPCLRHLHPSNPGSEVELGLGTLLAHATTTLA